MKITNSSLYLYSEGQEGDICTKQCSEDRKLSFPILLLFLPSLGHLFLWCALWLGTRRLLCLLLLGDRLHLLLLHLLRHLLRLHRLLHSQLGLRLVIGLLLGGNFGGRHLEAV